MSLSRLFPLAGAVDRLSRLLEAGRRHEAACLLRDYLAWYGSGSVSVELHRNFRRGDSVRNRELGRLAREHGVPLIASNDVHYHAPKRYRLQNALVAVRRNLTLDQALPFISPNSHLSLKSPRQMAELFGDCPEALANTVRVAANCTFNLSTDLGCALPEPDVPAGYTPLAT